MQERDFSMKIKDGFILREVAGSCVVIGIGGDSVDFDGMINVNDTGAFLWKKLTEGSDEASLVRAMLDEYDVDEETAKKDIAEFVELLRSEKLIEENE